MIGNDNTFFGRPELLAGVSKFRQPFGAKVIVFGRGGVTGSGLALQSHLLPYLSCYTSFSLTTSDPLPDQSSRLGIPPRGWTCSMFGSSERGTACI